MFTERRKLYRDDLRRLCIEKNWYTRGHNEDYEDLLKKADAFENVTTEQIEIIARNILQNSETEYPLEEICFLIARICFVYFEKCTEESLLKPAAAFAA